MSAPMSGWLPVNCFYSNSDSEAVGIELTCQAFGVFFYGGFVFTVLVFSLVNRIETSSDQCDDDHALTRISD